MGELGDYGGQELKCFSIHYGGVRGVNRVLVLCGIEIISINEYALSGQALMDSTN